MPKAGSPADTALFVACSARLPKRLGRWSRRPPNVSSPCFRRRRHWPRLTNGCGT
jgi:hypothetical protein